MTPREYLDAAKARLAVTSDYELAKKAGIPRQDIPGMRSGKRAIPLHLAYWLAITLELDPAQVVADLESQREKNEGRAEFWRSFALRARQVVLILACTLVSISSGGAGSERGPHGGFKRRQLFA